MILTGGGQQDPQDWWGGVEKRRGAKTSFKAKESPQVLRKCLYSISFSQKLLPLVDGCQVWDKCCYPTSQHEAVALVQVCVSVASSISRMWLQLLALTKTCIPQLDISVCWVVLTQGCVIIVPNPCHPVGESIPGKLLQPLSPFCSQYVFQVPQFPQL